MEKYVYLIIKGDKVEMNERNYFLNNEEFEMGLILGLKIELRDFEMFRYDQLRFVPDNS